MEPYLRKILYAAMAVMIISGCAGPRVKLFTDDTDPLVEYTLEGKGKGKVLVIPVHGVINDSPKSGLLRSSPGMVQEVMSRLKLAEIDKNIRAVVIKIDSRGGTVSASDMLYHEILTFKERKKIPVVAALMGLAASGGYYIALPADVILAHPTTVTGSIGVIFLQPQVSGLMEKLGVSFGVNKSGKYKDMLSPFRAPVREESDMVQEIVDKMAERFHDLVRKHRKPSAEAMKNITGGQVMSADEALKLGLVDKIGYLSDALALAKSKAGLPDDARVVVYRRAEYGNDNIYNVSGEALGGRSSLLAPVALDAILPQPTGFYYMWMP